MEEKLKTNRLKNIIDKIYSDRFTNSDIGMMFVWLRPIAIAENNPIILDLANFVIHYDVRDRGGSYKHILKYVTNFIEVSEKAGTIHGLAPVFNKDKVIEELVVILRKLKLTVNESKIMEQKDKIINCLFELMEETEFSLRDKDPRIAGCYLKLVDGKMMFCLNLDLKGPYIKTSPSMTIRSVLIG